ncbi:D-2-hydroxyacid dehydrogenase [Limosilactobacillus sp. STM2_1]|uniref:D-2-hydroxyacid dehydrogenase n=1 Tax=Limosilactobacillus rudii TaxID=2759755 RepID=A0A7W3UKI6_9LACO|nr:D-2-hydroxyacid dehydrogenase [Limosilactobacillus rudii]MBB1078617.1 D-2-hydroxyacid dehydrogenase [Limosilactobacillus rudii]MBB1097257.1 D-2-hydroxyacid dehydrogenase [Limosilactobacillus rudii]MCD7133827.1 D-2-hydroxyacid dehydrogenase [Limosilactobacillus rudii]
MKIYVYGVYNDEVPYIKEWQQEHPEVTVETTTKLLNEESVDLSKGSNGVVVFQQEPYSDGTLKKLASNGITKMSLRNVGVDNINHELANKLGFQITNVPVYSPAAIAEFSVTQALNLLRRTKEFYLKLGKGDYNWAPHIAKEMNNQVVGIVGTGNIGSTAAKMFAGFGAKVIAYSRHKNPELEKIVEYVELEELYKRSTIISLYLPHVPATSKMLNEETFSMMKDGVLIINTARGPLIDENALIKALDSGRVGGAALDVLVGETKIFNQQIDEDQVDYPEFKNLLKRPNVLITPHIAFYTDQAVKNMVKMSLSANLDLITKGTSDKLVEF